MSASRTKRSCVLLIVRQWHESKRVPRGIPAGFGGKSSEGPEAYERMWRETEPQGYAGTKPLRGWETLGAEGVGEASRRATIRVSDFAERHETPGRCPHPVCEPLVGSWGSNRGSCSGFGRGGAPGRVAENPIVRTFGLRARRPGDRSAGRVARSWHGGCACRTVRCEVGYLGLAAAVIL